MLRGYQNAATSGLESNTNRIDEKRQLTIPQVYPDRPGFTTRRSRGRSRPSSWSFGGSATARTKSDGSASWEERIRHHPHVCRRSGDYIVRVEHVIRMGQKAIVHLFVRVGDAEAVTVSKREYCADLFVRANRSRRVS
jgi:hypothetical protein